jgi:hypothetical protein
MINADDTCHYEPIVTDIPRMNRYRQLSVFPFGVSGNADPPSPCAKRSPRANMRRVTPESVDLVVIKTHLSHVFL